MRLSQVTARRCRAPCKCATQAMALVLGRLDLDARLRASNPQTLGQEKGPTHL